MVLLALMGSGLARAEGAGVSFGVDGGPGELTLVHTGFRAEVSAGVAVVDVDQLFHNPYDHPIDATYLFPLPPDAAVRSMRIVCGGRRLEGVLLPLDQARARYRQAAADGRKAALLEQERTNLFRQSVANLCPDEDVRVELQYLDPLRIEDGRHELVVPTTVGPLYRPDGTPEPPFTALPAHTVDFEVVIDEGLPVGSVWSDTHGIDVDEDPTGRVTVRNLDDDAIPNKDFELDWTFAGGEPQVGVIAVPPTGARTATWASRSSPRCWRTWPSRARASCCSCSTSRARCPAPRSRPSASWSGWRCPGCARTTGSTWSGSRPRRSRCSTSPSPPPPRPSPPPRPGSTTSWATGPRWSRGSAPRSRSRTIRTACGSCCC
jgi:hypothetical protein